MEELFFWDDRPAYPCACFFRLAFRGELKRLELEEALAQTLSRYPFFTSKVEFDGAGRPRWCVPDHPQFVICWHEELGDQELPSAGRIDLSAEYGIRFFASSGGGQSCLIIQFHHACSDGLGITRFFRDLLATYRERCGTILSTPEERVTKLGAQKSSRWWLPSRVLGVLWRAFLLARRSPLPLCAGNPAHPESPLPEEYPSAVWQSLDPQETACLVRAAARQKVTLNTLLLRDLLLALADWRGPTSQRGWIRILVPVLSEKARVSSSPIPDPVSMIFLDVHTEEINSPHLLHKIQRDLLAKRQSGEDDLLQKAIGLERRRGKLAKHVRANKCLFTTIFSNLGKVQLDSHRLAQGGGVGSDDLRLESAQGIHVIRRHCPANFAALIVKGSLSLTMSFDSRILSRTDAERLLQGLLGTVRDSVKLGV